MKKILPLPFFLTLLLIQSITASQSQVVKAPAYNAYSLPNPNALLADAATGLTGWKSAAEHVLWVVKLIHTGQLHIGLSLELPKSDSSQFQLNVLGKHFRATANGNGSQSVTVSFGSVNIVRTGYVRFELYGLKKTGAVYGSLHNLLLSGQASINAPVVIPPAQRGAPSVHLFYTLPQNSDIVAFYNQVRARTTPLNTYYMACGWQRGYFGMQVNSPTRRTILFSVWDNGNVKIDPNLTPPNERAGVVKTGSGVQYSRFGNEGTGSHCMFRFPWHKGHTYCFLVTAQREHHSALYSGYFYAKSIGHWKLIGTIRVPKYQSLYGLYSFDEDFWGSNGYLRRSAEFNNTWIQQSDGSWSSLNQAVFSDTGGKWRSDYNSYPVHNGFVLSAGAFKDGSVQYGSVLTRPYTTDVPYHIPAALGGPTTPYYPLQMSLNTTAAPDLAAWGEKAVKLTEHWFPIISRFLACPGALPPAHSSITIRPMSGVAYTAGGQITVSANYVRSNPKDIGLVVHELTHVVQSYPPSQAGWLVEGIADYVRFWIYQVHAPRPYINPDKANYTDAYQTTAAFLAWVTNHYNKNLVPKLSCALRRGVYTDDLFQKLTGFTVQTLWQQFTQQIRNHTAHGYVIGQ